MNRKILVLLSIITILLVTLVGCANIRGVLEDYNEFTSQIEKVENTNGEENDEEQEGDKIGEENNEEQEGNKIGEENESDKIVSPEQNENDEKETLPKEEEKKEDESSDSTTKNPIATMTMKNGDVIKMELYPDIAPETVKNFISLANSGFYDGLIFHRVIPSFMAQGGDPKGNGTGGPGYSIKGEFKLNGVENNLTHDIGVVSMARSTDYNSAGSQFFIVTDDEYSKESLDGQYAGFGKVIEGMEHVYTIVNSEVIRRDIDQELVKKINNEIYTTGDVSMETYDKYYAQMMEVDRPKNPPVIKTITVETFGVEYGEPVKY